MALGTLFVVSAASGTGKTSLLRAVRERDTSMYISVSYTTRPPRENEKNGINYHFINDDEFDALLATDAFIEHADVFGYRYGTTRISVEQTLNDAKNVLLEIDYQGALSVKQYFPQSVSIFILPPNRASLHKRLHERNDRTSNLELRLQKQQLEMQQSVRYDYIVINDDFDVATNDILSIIRAQGLCTARQQTAHKALLEDLFHGTESKDATI